MKRIRWYKKGYKGLRLDTLLMGMLSIVIVLEINLGSGTLNMPDMVLVLLGVLSVGIFDAIIYVKGQRIRLEVRDSKRAVFSANAFRALKIVNIYGGIPLLPLVFMILSKENQQRLFWWLISVMALIVVKCFFDDIITFTKKGYSSGFDEIELDATCTIKMRKLDNVPRFGELCYIELYRNNRFFGWDRLMQEDVIHIVNVLQQKNNNSMKEENVM